MRSSASAEDVYCSARVRGRAACLCRIPESLNESHLLSRSNTTLVSRFDCPGGGQVWVEGTTMYVGHQRPTSGTIIVDVSDPSAPRHLATIDVPDGWHSQKVRVADGIMVVNHGKFGKSSCSDIGGGLAIYDVSR